MGARYLRWTRKGGDVVNFSVHDEHIPLPDHQVIDRYDSQNRVRHVLSMLERTAFCGHSAIPGIWDLRVTRDPKTGNYGLWCYCRNWRGRASFLAGIVVGKSHKWRKIERRLRRRKNRRTQKHS